MVSASDWGGIIATQVILAGLVAIWWSGWYAVQGKDDRSGWSLLLIGSVGILGWFFLFFHFRGNDWLSPVLALGVILLSVPIYRLYEKEQTRVFVQWGLAAGFSSLIAAFAVYLTIDTGRMGGYIGLVLALEVSVFLTWLARRRALRTWQDRFRLPLKQTPQRDLGCLTSIGTAIGISLAAATFGLRERIPPELQAGSTSFIIGCLGFSLLGISGWALLWEIKKRRG